MQKQIEHGPSAVVVVDADAEDKSGEAIHETVDDELPMNEA